MLDTNGVVTIQNNDGVFAGDANANTLTGTTVSQVSQVSVSNIVKNIMGIATNAVTVVYDAYNRILKAWGSPSTAAVILAGVPGTKSYVLTPVAGESGVSLKFQATADAGFDATTKAALDALIAPVAPKFSAAQLLQTAASVLPSSSNHAIVLDQASGAIRVFYNPTADALRSSVLNMQNPDLFLTLSEPATTGKLKFEGGSF